MVGLASGLSTELPRSNSTQAGSELAELPAVGQLPTVWATEGAANSVPAAARARAKDLVMGEFLSTPARQTAGDRCRRTSCRRRSWSGRRTRRVRRLRRLWLSGGP